MRAEFQIADKQIILLKGDIVTAKVDVIVNAANPVLAGGGGVDGAIHRAAGPALLRVGRYWVKENGRLMAGQAILTPGFCLNKSVIHTVGPIWRGGENNEAEILSDCYKNSLLRASEKRFTSIAFSAISCGVYGYPHDQAARIALRTVAENLAEASITKVYFYLFSSEMFVIWSQEAQTILA